MSNMKAGRLLPGAMEESLSTMRTGFSKSITPVVLIVLTLLNLWLAAKPNQVQQLLVVPNCCASSHSGSDQRTERAPHLSPPEQAETLLQNLQFPNDTWRTFPTTARHDPTLGYDYGLAHRVGWVKNKTRVWECMNKLGPRRQISFLGDSVTREFYAQLVLSLGAPITTCSWVGQTDQNMGHHWWLAHGDLELDSGETPS